MTFANYNPQSWIKMCRSLFDKLENFFLPKFEKWQDVFLSQCNVEIVPRPGFKGLSCSKTAGFEGGLFQKNFNGYIFYFLGQLFGGQLFELFARETNLKKQSSVTFVD